jgi:hypothetical protein
LVAAIADVAGAVLADAGIAAVDAEVAGVAAVAAGAAVAAAAGALLEFELSALLHADNDKTIAAATAAASTVRIGFIANLLG